MKEITSSCIYCGCGCKLNYQVEKGKVIGVNPDPTDYVSEGEPCIKGTTCWESFYTNRLTSPQIRKTKNNKLQNVTWDEALNFIKENLEKMTPKNIAVIGSGSLSNEDNYLISKFARSVLKTNNVDSSARLCHAATVKAATDVYGVGASPDYFEDIKQSDFILTIGTNPAGNYPVMFNNKIKSVLDNGGILVSVDVTPSETLEQATVPVVMEYQGITAFLGGLLRLWFADNPAPAGNDELQAIQESVDRFDPEFVEEFCTVKEKTILQAYKHLKNAKNKVVMFGMGITQHVDGTENATTAITLAEVIGAKVVPMRGKINIQGSGDVGVGSPEFVPFGKDGEKIIKYWGVNPQDCSDGKDLVEVFLDSETEAFVVFSSDPAKSLPNINIVNENLKNAFVVCANCHPTKLQTFADVVLPLPKLPESEGTYTNAERKVRKIEAVTKPYEKSRPVWEIICDLAKLFSKEKYFDYENPKQIFEEITKAIPAYQNLVWNKEDYADKRKKYIKLNPIRHLYPKNPPPEEYPVVLTTARSKFHFCTGETTFNVETLKEQHPEPTCLLGSKEAGRWGIEDGDIIKITSDSGEITIKAEIENNMPEHLIVVPFHFDSALVNKLTSAKPKKDVDGESGTPNYKAVFVRVEKV